jgi:RNA polymerase sigma factor (sigma-70 family)
MDSTESNDWLRAYAQRGDEAAFRRLVERHVNLVYSAALRQMRGDAQGARDVTQVVFMDLARKARRLPRDLVVGGWLYRHTCYTAAKAVRTERRRRAREQEAVIMNASNPDGPGLWAQLAPDLDEAMNGLKDADRDAVVLRFFQSQSLREVGLALGVSEDAARMRVERALERLRGVLARRGITLTAAGLGLTLAGHAVVAAPAGLAASVAAGALAGAAAATGTGTIASSVKLLSLMKLKATLVTSVLATGLAGALVVQHRTQARLEADNSNLRQQAAALERLRETPPRTPAVDPAEFARLQREHLELLRLRGEVGRLRESNAELARVREEYERLRAGPAGTAAEGTGVGEDDGMEELRRNVVIMKLNYAKAWGLAFILYADANGGMVPQSFAQAADHFPAAYQDLRSTISEDKYEIVYRGKLDAIQRPAQTILIREKEAVPHPSKPGATRTYMFGDGHSENHYAEGGAFDAWEQERMQPAPAL